MMRTWIRWGAALGLALALVGCGDDDDDGFNPTVDDVAGSYTATTFTATSGSGEVDLLALGASVTATLEADGTTTGQLLVPGFGENGETLDEDLTGTWTLAGTTVTFSPSASTLINDVDFAVGPNTLTGEGTFDSSLLLLVLTKDE
jgi:hypothetical protein